jgi:hypothetical protein
VDAACGQAGKQAAIEVGHWSYLQIDFGGHSLLQLCTCLGGAVLHYFAGADAHATLLTVGADSGAVAVVCGKHASG